MFPAYDPDDFGPFENGMREDALLDAKADREWAQYEAERAAEAHERLSAIPALAPYKRQIIGNSVEMAASGTLDFLAQWVKENCTGPDEIEPEPRAQPDPTETYEPTDELPF